MDPRSQSYDLWIYSYNASVVERFYNGENSFSETRDAISCAVNFYIAGVVTHGAPEAHPSTFEFTATTPSLQFFKVELNL
jgi:hypothetical protein